MLAFSASIVFHRSRVQSQLKSGVSLRSLSRSGFLLCIRPIISSPLLKRKTCEFYSSVASAERLIVHRSVSIHLLNLSDGSPYSSPPSNVITWETLRWTNGVHVRSLSITSSRIAVQLYYWEDFWEDDGDPAKKLLVWDWKTGKLVKLTRLGQQWFAHFIFTDSQPPVRGPDPIY